MLSPSRIPWKHSVVAKWATRCLMMLSTTALFTLEVHSHSRSWNRLRAFCALHVSSSRGAFAQIMILQRNNFNNLLAIAATDKHWAFLAEMRVQIILH